MKKFFICSTAACTERMLDCQKIYSYLIRNNWQSVKKISKADLIIISTCSFNNYEDDSSVELIKHYLRRKSKLAKLIIAGCMLKINPSRLNQMGEFLTISPTDLCKLDELLKSQIRFHDIEEPNRIFASEVSYKPILKKILNCKSLLNIFFNQFELRKDFFRKCKKFITKAINYTILLKSYINPFLVCNRNDLFYLRISKGCLGNCSYCGKKFATGALKSKLPEDVINEFGKGLNLGHKKFFFLSEDVGCYGLDIDTTIIYLLKEIFRVGKNYDYQLIISNFNAHWFVKYYEEIESVLLENHSKVFYLQIPIQSGSNKILSLMNRPYRIEDVERCLLDLKKKAPSLNITTDIIVGFPGETEANFNLSKNLIKKIKFSFADIFGYEDRPNTLASKMDNKIPQDIINNRLFDLLRIQNLSSRTDSIVKKIIELSKGI